MSASNDKFFMSRIITDTELFSKLKSGVVSHENYDNWGKLAGGVDNIIFQQPDAYNTRLKISLDFWVELLKVIYSLEKKTKVVTHKGLIFFKFASRKLTLYGYDNRAVIIWLNKAINEDKRLYDKIAREGRSSEEIEKYLWNNQSAFRIRQIIYAYTYYYKTVKKNPDLKKVVSLLDNAKDEVGQTIASLYDISISIHPARNFSIGGRYFFSLKNSSRERKLFSFECHEGAKYLINLDPNEIKVHNCADYGIAKAIIILCGSTIEGVLLSKRIVRKKFKEKYKNSLPTLGKVMAAYFLTQNNPDKINIRLFVRLILINYSRNLVHSERHIHYMKSGNKLFATDLNFARFIWSVTQEALISLK